MPAPQGNYDQHGFPIPQRFDDQPLPPPPRSTVDVRRRRLRWIFTPVLIAAIFMLLWRSSLSDFGRQAMSEHYLHRARESYFNDDLQQSLTYLNRAIEWHADAINARLLRISVEKRLNQIDAAIADLTKLLSNRKLPSDILAQFYMERGFLYQRANRPQEALDDMNQAFELKPAKSASYANGRAYLRALLNVELEEALADIQLAFKWDGQPLGKETNAAFIDTRGYIYFRMEKYPEALADFNQAIKLMEQQLAAEDSVDTLPPSAQRRRKFELQELRLALGETYHHRGEAYAAQKKTAQAEADFATAKQFGFPADTTEP